MAEEEEEILTLWVVSVTHEERHYVTTIYARDEREARRQAKAFLGQFRTARQTALFQAHPDGFGTGSTFYPGRIVQKREGKKGGGADGTTGK